MTEAESHFWSNLEFRFCREIAGLRRKPARPYWCDGFIPRSYLLDDPIPRVEGRVWIGIGGLHQEEWTFTLLLVRPVGSAEELDWTSLLPPNDVTRWLTLDPRKKHLVIEPSVAIPDMPRRLLER